MTQQDAICKALLARGYIEVRRAGKYRKFDRQRIENYIEVKPISKRQYVLVGPQGALRVTSGSIANSVSLSDHPIHAMLIAEGQSRRASDIEI